jgi:hypothetical protein
MKDNDPVYYLRDEVRTWLEEGDEILRHLNELPPRRSPVLYWWLAGATVVVGLCVVLA